MRLLIAGGGTGGHIYPALAVADALRRRDAGADLAWVGGAPGLQGSIVRPSPVPPRRPGFPFPPSVKPDVHLVLDPVRLAISVPQAMGLLARRRPAAIFTTGGYVAIPIVLAARALGIPTLLWEGNLRPGRSSRAIAGLVSAIAVSAGETCTHLPKRIPCFETGTPIRDLTGTDRAAARTRLGIPPEAQLILVFGGSQAVRRFNEAVLAALPDPVARRVVIHRTGDDRYGSGLDAHHPHCPRGGLLDRSQPFPPGPHHQAL